MAEILSALGKAKKITLPPGWVERFSKKHPDRPFYFNKNTGESRWSMPLDTPQQAMDKPERKGKKRKNSNEDCEQSSDASSSVGVQLLNTTTSNRPKIKAKRQKDVTADGNPSHIDTPAMRLYREKLAQRKAAMEAKKALPKKVIHQKPKLIPKSSKTVSSPSSTKSLNMRRTSRSTSITSLNESISSNCSTISNASSMGSKIKASAVSIAKLSTKNLDNSIQSSDIKLTKIKRLSNKSDSSPNLTDNVKKNRMSEVSKKNTANERMVNIRKSLSLEKQTSPLNKSLNRLSNNNNVNKLLDKDTLLNSATPILSKNAQIRLYSLENRVESCGVLEISRTKQLKVDEEENANDKRILEKIEVADLYCEEMEWEPIEDEKIMSEVYSVRFQLSEKPIEKSTELPCNSLQSVDTLVEKTSLYIVIDTNVFLSNLSFIEEVKESHSDIFGRPFIVIPWTVIQELDYIKDDKNNMRTQALKHKAKKAVEFLNRHFTAKHPRFLGQTSMDAEQNKIKFMIECPDDSILQTCLQIKESSKSPVLLSYDKNLCNKAMIHDIPVLGRNDPLEKIYYLKAAETTEFLSNSLHAQMEKKSEDISIKQKELLEADDIMEEGKAILKSVLSEVVAKEMENLFGTRWEMHVIIRPPWSVITVLKCALKHWMAAVSESFIRRTEPMLRDLLQCINDIPEGGRKLQDVKCFLEKCNDVYQTLNAVKYPDLKLQILSMIDDLRRRCINAIDVCSKSKFKESVGWEEDACEEEKRASLAFKVFEDIYAFARDSCGIASFALGLQCSFSYNKMHPFITTKLALEQQQDVGINVNKLLQLLRLILSKLDEGILQHPNEKCILALYEVLVNFSSDLNFDELTKLTPLDLFCCIKLNKPKLEKGYEQLQELAIHFCRMANYQCT